MSGLKNWAPLLVAALSIIGVMTVGFYQTIQYRLFQIDLQFEKVGQGGVQGRTAGLGEKLELYKRRMTQVFESEDDYLRETRAFSEFSTTAENKFSYSYLVAKVTELFDTANGMKNAHRAEYDRQTLNQVHAAYYYQNMRNYTRALDIYQRVLSKFSGRELANYIKIQIAFCHAMQDDYGQAQSILAFVAKHAEEIEYRKFSKRMNMFIGQILANRKLIQSRRDDLLKAEMLFRNSNYKEALQVLEKIERKYKGQSRFYYFKGRTYEELGNSKAAIVSYEKALRSKDDFAKHSNRRLFLIGAIYEPDSKLKKSALRNAQKDFDDAAYMQKSSAIVSTVAARLQQSQANAEKTNREVSAAPPPPKLVIEQTDSVLEESESNSDLSNNTAKAEVIQPLQFATTQGKVNLQKPYFLKSSNPEKRKLFIISKFSHLYRVVLNDGNIFYGAKISDSVTSISLYSLLGDLTFEKNVVTKITKVPTHEVYK